uniref:Vestigial-like family member 3 n=2 Tax=Sphaeramia orbicularis TaxID=375764 RepID=A0A673AY88_9TELE
MSCLDVMYHQSYGAHYLPATAYKPTYYNHQQQQRKLSVYSKMQECMEQQPGGGRGMLHRDQGLRQGLGTESVHRPTSDSDQKDITQPEDAEYFGSQCVVFYYFKGKSNDVVDEHFSRALSQSSSFNSETKPIRVTQSPATTASGVWKDGVPLSEGQSSSSWNTACTSQAVPVHPDFSTSPVPFNHPDGALWAGHVFSQPPTTLPESWPYSLNPQSPTSYPNVHDVYHTHTHPHIHTRHHHHHHHPMLHSYPAHTSTLDPRFSPLLLPGVRNQNQPSASTSSDNSPHNERVKTEMDPSSSTTSVSWTPSGLHGALEVYDSALDQTKAKTSGWF